MRKLLTLAALVFLASVCHAQGGNTLLIRFAGAPSGSCAPFMLGVNNATGAQYDCLSGSWNLVGGGGGGTGTVTSVLGTTNQINSDGSTTTPTLSLSSTLLFPGTTAPATDNANSSGDSTHRWTNIFTKAVNCGVGGTTSCVITGNGSTSGTATITWPATAGTTTNPFVFSNATQLPASSGSNCTNGLQFGASSPPMISGDGTPNLYICLNAVQKVQYFQSEIISSSGVVLDWFASGASGSRDTGISRSAAGVLAIGNSAAGGTTGGLKLSYLQSAGTKFTASGCSNSTTVGGATAGSFASGTTGACTVVITMGDTDTATNGWACRANDLTTPANLISQSASSTTTCTVTGTTVSGDVLNFSAIAY